MISANWYLFDYLKASQTLHAHLEHTEFATRLDTNDFNHLYNQIWP